MVRQCMKPRERPKRERRRRLATLVAGLVCCAADDCDAIDRVTLEFGQLSTAAVQAKSATITLDLTRRPDSGSPTVDVRAAQLRLIEQGATYTDLDINCTDLLIEQPQFACKQGSIAARGGPTGQIAMNAAATYDTSTGAVSISGSGLKVAAAVTRFDGKLQWGTWSLNVSGEGLDLVAAGKLAQPWLQLPTGDTLSGHLGFRLAATGQLTDANRPGKTRVHLEANSADLNFSNQPGTTVAQNLTVTLTGSATREPGKLASDLKLQSSAGQALAGAVLLDFARNPLSLAAHIEPDAAGLNLSQIQLHQTDLMAATGTARIAFGGPVMIQRGHFDVDWLEFAAAYRSFLQLALATTDFGALNAGGRASGEFDIANDAVSTINARIQNVSLADATRGTSRTGLSLANANGELHWAADHTAPATSSAQPSQLSWSASSAYGLIGGAVQMTFTAQGNRFTLAGNTRFPIFDGALVVHTLDIRHFGPDAELDFDAHLEPISMPLLSKAFGWPVLSGRLAGRVPGVAYRDHVLTVQGDLSADVFDGTIVGSRFKLIDPLGPWPRLDADVSARHLDLDLLTHTFSIGSISGRLDADIKGLELFNWSPVAFDARLQTTPGDDSEHRISQKAVTSISSVGGGGGGVAAALQSGVLQFFKTFHYDRIGISCQLRDEVCLMNGLEPAKTGYYLVKGRGLPRIDIIGNAGRVDWTQMVAQIAASMHSQNIIVR
jgi:hypothetical protein